jgi:hypothetical protein
MKAIQKRIECAYTRAMNIRDSTPGSVPESVEVRYSKSYRRCYRSGNAEQFTEETKLYLKAVRQASVPSERVCGHRTIGGCHHCRQCFACCNDHGCRNSINHEQIDGGQGPVPSGESSETRR